MQNYIFITREADPMAIADRLKDDGKNVVVGLIAEEGKNAKSDKNDCRESLYEGIIDWHDAEEVLKWMKGLPNKEEYFVFLDFGDLWPWSERILKMGFRSGLFPTEEGYKLEDDRTAGKKFAKEHYPDLKVAEAHEFKKIEDAIKLLEDQKDKIFVLKSEGSNAETVVPETDDPELARKQIIGALHTEKSDYEKGFTLEEKIPNPIEISPVMIFWNGKPLASWVEFENKPLGAGNIGRYTGGCQNLTVQTRLDCQLNKIAFPPIVYDMAKKQPGIGIYDAGLLFDGHHFYFSEWCSQRYGWDGIFSTIEMSGDAQHKNAASRHFDLIADGKNPFTWKYGCAVRMFQTQPDGKRPDVYEDGYAVDWMDEVSDHLWFYSIKKREEDEGGFESVGYRKDVGAATGAGNTPKDAIDMAYRAVKGVAMTGLLYRAQFDFLSKDYFTSIPNRYEFLMKSGLIA